MKSAASSIPLLLILAGCASPGPSDKEAAAVGSPQSQLPLPISVPALPRDYSLGATSLTQRDEICEAVVRFVAMTNKCVIGFENIVQGRILSHNPTDALLGRLRDLHSRVLPISRLNGLRVYDGMVVDYEAYPDRAVYWLWGMSVESEDKATFDLRVEDRPASGSISYRYRLIRTRGKWTVIEEKAMGFSGDEEAEPLFAANPAITLCLHAERSLAPGC